MQGYASALLAKRAGLDFWLSMPLAALFTASVAFVLSFPLFRMKAFYFLIGSFAAGGSPDCGGSASAPRGGKIALPAATAIVNPAATRAGLNMIGLQG